MDLLPFVHMSAGCDLKFYYGTMPGADWHFVNAEGREVITALQHRLRELGESTEIVFVK